MKIKIRIIFKNLPFTQETLKESLVSAVLSSNQIEGDGIDLGSHRRSLEGFQQRYSDIKKMTTKGRNGKTVIDNLAEVIFASVDRYYRNQDEQKQIPGLLKYAFEATTKEISSLEEQIRTLTEKQSSNKTQWDERSNELDEKQIKVGAKKEIIDTKIKDILDVEKNYKDVDLEALLEWIRDKKLHKAEFESLNKTYDDLTADSKDIRQQMELAIENNKSLYKNRENKERERHNEKEASLQKEREAVGAEALQKRKEIEKKYETLLGKDWISTEKNLIDALVVAATKLANAETIEDIRRCIEDIPDKDTFLGILSDVLRSRNESEDSASVLESRLSEARSRIESELDRKISLEKEKAAELNKVSSEEKNRYAELDTKKEEEKTRFNSSIRSIVNECKDKETSIRQDYESRIHGNNAQLKGTLDDLNERIESEKFVLDQIELFPSAEKEIALIRTKPACLKERDRINLEKSELAEQKKKEKAAFDEENAFLGSSIENLKTTKKSLEEGLKSGNKFIEGRSHVKASMEAASPIENDRRIPDIINTYTDINETLNRLEKEIPEQVKRLYAPEMLSRIDTFQLGIGYNDSLSNFDDFLSVAEKLRVRLENSEDAMGLDKYIKLNSELWLNEIRDISTAMSPFESMLAQIQRLCRKATSFVNEHNTTDCIDSFSMAVDENDSTDLVRLLRQITRFYQENNLVLGFENLFSSDEEPANKEAIELLQKFSDLLNESGDTVIKLSSMFDIRMDIVEKGNAIKNVLSFNNPGSKAANTRLICAIDEMNTIEARNLDALTEFASAAGLYIFGSGQHHTKSALDYSYNVWDERQEDGSITKWIDMYSEQVS